MLNDADDDGDDDYIWFLQQHLFMFIYGFLFFRSDSIQDKCWWGDARYEYWRAAAKYVR